MPFTDENLRVTLRAIAYQLLDRRIGKRPPDRPIGVKVHCDTTEVKIILRRYEEPGGRHPDNGDGESPMPTASRRRGPGAPRGNCWPDIADFLRQHGPSFNVEIKESLAPLGHDSRLVDKWLKRMQEDDYIAQDTPRGRWRIK